MFRKISYDTPCSDHLGNIFGSIKAMCCFWNINPETFSRRRKVYKMTLEEALTKPVKSNGGKICIDHCGQKFYSEASMCRYWGVERKVYQYRISHGWDIESALTKRNR